MLTWVGIGFGVILAVVLYVRLKGDRDRVPANVPKPQQTRAEVGGRNKRPKPVPQIADSFKGQAVVPQKDACAAAMKMRGKTMPDGHAQQIPVPGCDRGSCDCKVTEVRGRRGDPRRKKIDRRDNVRFKDDRRKGKDRRQGVDAWNRGNA